MKTVVVSVSGGKDSTATALLAVTARHPEWKIRIVFADTGHEHALTYEYVTDYLPSALSRLALEPVQVEIVRADFSEQIARKRRYIEERWPAEDVPPEFCERALRVLYPTGIPFLDLCLWKGRFPSRMAQFCTQELKRYPLDAFLLERLADGEVENWQGVRRDESRNRSAAAERESTAEGWTIVRPIVTWTAQQVVHYVRGWGLKLNPLYQAGMGRVGCMPCINCRKDELAEIANRYPEYIDRVRQWEQLVSEASKLGFSSFFNGGRERDDETAAETYERSRIDNRVQWAKTSHGGKQLSLLKTIGTQECSSIYGLCE